MLREEAMTMMVMRKMIGQFVLDVRHTDHLELIIAEFVNVASEEWIIIVRGK